MAKPIHDGKVVNSLKYMAKFAAEYPDREFVQQVVALMCGRVLFYAKILPVLW